MTADLPLVSIIVITYNSSKYVLETLESAKAQTYQNIELIISDDGSTDKTIEICENWLAENKERFVHIHIITVEKNTGIPANCNRGVKATKGEWVKLIAGDDQLRENCIECNISYIVSLKEVEVLQTVSRFYYDTFTESNFFHTAPNDTSFFDLSAEEQYNCLLRSNLIIAPSTLIKKSCVERVGGFDEDFKLMEDYTMWLSLTKNGVKVHFLDTETVNYRIHSPSVQRNGKVHISPSFCLEQIKFYRKYMPQSLSRKLEILRFNLFIIYDKIGLNNNSLISKFLYSLTSKIFNSFS